MTQAREVAVMLPNLFNSFRKKLHIGSVLFYVLVLSLISIPAYAQNINVSGLNAQTMIENLVKQMPQLMQMVTAIAYVMGMYMIIQAIVKMKHLGESRTMMSHEHSIKGPLILLTVGALLLYLPSSVQVGMSTFWTDPSPYGYLQEQQQWQDFINDCFIIVQFIGTIAFIRGLVIFSHLSDGRGQATFGKGLTHIIGGIFCINIYQFVQVIMVTFGMQS